MKPTRQEIIELAREHATRYTNRHYPEQTVFTFTQDKLEEFANLLLERFGTGAGGGEPVARLMKYVGKGTYPKKGYTVARTYEECPKDAYPNDWEEGPELHTHPSPTDLRDEYERGLDDAAKAFEAEADTWKAWPQAGAAKRKGVKAIEALKGKQ